MWENADQKISEYGHFSRSVKQMVVIFSDFMQSLDTGVFNKDHILLIQSLNPFHGNISGSLMSSRGTERKTGQGARNIH